MALKKPKQVKIPKMKPKKVRAKSRTQTELERRLEERRKKAKGNQAT